MMARYSGPPVSAQAPMPAEGRAGLETGHDGPLRQSGNFPGAFDSRGDQTPSAGQEGERTRNAVRELVRRNGGAPADLERPMARGRSGGLMTSYESHQAGQEAVGVNPPGPMAGGSFESHDGPSDGSGPEKC